ncbi:toprim domain-containing protein [Roseovarius atlanticus]|uniref:DUF7146 domain-containing protein n=1 Tax=Roseovarius atlanticus TaxID=1641875 RepID=UPI001C979ACE|nr:toprim domain-containing protein [Roseovarius atlanticus]MBY5988195.1 toprim domain-containing protein [Roseovarius atlanticus]MBY6123586.1 toprim domain-containing protein [Roseovarius atlanticus]MBY6148081.1 toprim domain-containing protein [Roseovarius atlanticus]
MTQQTYSIEDIKHMLADRVEDVARHYAPEVQGSYTANGAYWTLNPGRADRSVGSFCVHLTGARRGRWNDYATNDRGDLLDLIALQLNCSLSEALREARRYLGLSADDPAAKRRREDALRRSRERAAQARHDDRQRAFRQGRQAQAIFLSGETRLRGTPVDYYLKGRGVDLAELGRQPGALRYLPNCKYYDEDPETGEVIEAMFPAMVAIVTDWRGNQTAVHRTYLGLDGNGCWAKASVRQPKKVLGSYAGAAINIWRGIGPRGGKPASLPQCPPGSHVFITEGIEDALSVVLLKPAARVIAAISLGNLGALQLPKNVSDITLVADQDENDQARAALERAIATHQDAGRAVRIWQNGHGGKDLNDALRAARRAKQGAA